jgi:hypothetical protein
MTKKKEDVQVPEVIPPEENKPVRYMAIMRNVSYGISPLAGAPKYPVLYFLAFMSEEKSSWIIVEDPEIISQIFILNNARNVSELEIRPCWVTAEEGVIKFFKPFG